MKNSLSRNSFITAIVLALVLTVTVFSVYAIDVHSSKQNVEITDAIKAADVCEEHLVKDCDICGENGLNSSYNTICPNCNTSMILCCSESMKTDNYRASCYVSSHPDGCETIQDLYWNAYYCPSCGYFQRGSRSNDYHVEAYYHTKDSSCYDNAYCSLPRLSDLTQANNPEPTSTDSSSHSADNVKDAVAAADYCEVHHKFACDIPHED
jgi:hypothetical protein